MSEQLYVKSETKRLEEMLGVKPEFKQSLIADMAKDPVIKIVGEMIDVAENLAVPQIKNWAKNIRHEYEEAQYFGFLQFAEQHKMRDELAHHIDNGYKTLKWQELCKKEKK